MAKSRTISFKGPAAAAFVNAQMGNAPADDDEKLARVATFVFGHVKSGDMTGAKVLLKIMAQEGLDAACAAVSK